MEEKQKGGKRNGSGRKPSDDPKIPVTVYLPKSKIEINGGKPELVVRITEAVNNDFMVNPIFERGGENLRFAKTTKKDKKKEPINSEVNYSPVTPNSYDAAKNSHLLMDEYGQTGSISRDTWKHTDPNFPVRNEGEGAIAYKIRCAEYNESKTKK